MSPYSPSDQTAFDHDGEMVRFFDWHLRGVDDGAAADPPIRYFTMVEERWKSAATWPPEGSRLEPWYLSEGRELSPARPSSTGIDEYRVDPDVGSGGRSRWDSLLGVLPPVGYSRRAHIGARLLVYRSAPLARDSRVTGHPVLWLRMTANTKDAQVFAYLEDERPDGRVYYVTEGELRALHRRTSMKKPPYLPAGPYHTFERADAAPLGARRIHGDSGFRSASIPWLFRRGHRIRLALAAADADHFQRLKDVPIGAFVAAARMARCSNCR